MENNYFECQCGFDEHRLMLCLDVDTDEPHPNLYTSIFMDSEKTFWQRVWTGIKYIFGYRSKYGHFGCWCVDPKDAVRMRELLDKYIAHAKEKGYEL